MSYNFKVVWAKHSRVLTLFLTAIVWQALGQAPKPKRELDVPYVPTRDAVVAAMLQLAGVKKGDILYDLGCGDGRIVIAAAQKFGARGTGIDIDPVRIKEARENARKAGVAGRVKFIEQDLFDSKFSDATVVMLYLFPDINLKLRPKLLRDLKAGNPHCVALLRHGRLEAG